MPETEAGAVKVQLVGLEEVVAACEYVFLIPEHSVEDGA